MKKDKVTLQEKARRNRLLFWTILVILLNLSQILIKNWLTSTVAMVGTVYALYRIVVYDNPKNHFSLKYYNWRGKKI